MEDVNKTEKSKATYEELQQYCNNLYMQNQQLGSRLNQVTDIMNKLPFLFEVLKAKDNFSASFVNTCIKEIEEIMTPPVEKNKD